MATKGTNRVVKGDKLQRLEQIRGLALEFANNPTDELEQQFRRVKRKEWKAVRTHFPYKRKGADDPNYLVRNVARQFEADLKEKADWIGRIASFALGLIGGVLSKYIWEVLILPHLGG